ncbi:Bromodomain-containing protein, partial [Pavlovales sp. CCMP2436]
MLLNPKSYYFREAIDPLELPDYFTVVTQPMDLGTVKQRLEGGDYDKLDEFEKDVHQVWNNCKLYNQPGSDAYRKGEDLEAMF